jgi:hypothetical protein
MLVSHTHKFVFIHIYKTAGTSIAKALAPYNVSPYKRRASRVLKRLRLPSPSTWNTGLSVEHKTAVEARDRLGHEVFDEYFSFAFVRNPWDWQLSVYQHVVRNERHALHKRVTDLASFENYVHWLCDQSIQHRDDRCQIDFLRDLSGNLLVDFVGRFESLPTDFSHVCRRIGVESTLPKLNTADRRVDYRTCYSDRTIDLIANKYADDIQAFGYRFD